MSRIDPKTRMAKRPINILGASITVRYLTDLEMRQFVKPDSEIESLDGLYREVEEEIVLSLRMNPRQQNEALTHEIIEAINRRLDLNLNHTQITSLAMALQQAGVRYVEP